MNSIIKKLVAIVLLAVFAFGLTTCKKEIIAPPTVRLFGDGPSSINITSAGVSAEVVDQGGAEVKSRGFVYGLSGGAMDTVFCGSGTGPFSTNLNNLQPNTTYVYEAFAKNAGGFGISGKVTFTTKDNLKPTVETGEVENVTGTTAEIGGNKVTNDGGEYVTERGICYSTDGNQLTVSGVRVPAGEDVGEFSCRLADLTPNTTYYFCSYAKNSKLGYGEPKSFTTEPLQSYTIEVSANPSNGGTVTGGGAFDEGQTCTVVATPSTGYNFVKWTENDEQVSLDCEYTFDVTGNRNLVANFTAQPYTITVTVEPEGSGTIEGDGGYSYDDNCTLTATANSGYVFSKWTEDGTTVYTQASYTFEVTGNRNLKAHFDAEEYEITATAKPVGGGEVSVSNNGRFNYGDQCTLTATPNTGYEFVKWTKGTIDGATISDENPYKFEVTESARYLGHFRLEEPDLPLSVTATADPNPIRYGESTTLNADATGGNGSYTYSWTPNTVVSNSHAQSPTASPSTTTTYTVTVSSNGQSATANVTVNVVRAPTNLTATVQDGNNVYLSWTAANPATSYKVYRGNTLIIQSNVTTTHYTDRNLSSGTYTYQVSAVYSNVESPKSNSASATVESQAPTGAINGVFSVGSGKRVYFSQGNLQYQISSNTWRFATNQYDYIGNANSNISSSYSGWIDLFGWGTSGWSGSGATYYRPWDSNNSNGSLYGPPGQHTLTGSYANSDWGVYNTIFSGNTATTGWRTLTQSEWDYVFQRRSGASSKYGHGMVNGRKGMILLPDDWTQPSGLSFIAGNSSWANRYTTEQWAQMEQNGAVFLPVAGYRNGTSVYYVGSGGFYWSASYLYSDCAYRLYFVDGILSTGNNYYRCYGLSVRLVRSAQ